MSLSSIINNFWDRLRTSFSKTDWATVIPFFLFLILSFIFWLILFFQKEAEGDYKMPLKYTNIPVDEVFVDTPPDYIQLRVKDFGSKLFRYYFFNKKDSLIIDVEKTQKENNLELQGNQLIQLVKTKLYANTEVTGFMPSRIRLKTSKLESKIVPVVFDGETRTSGGHLVVDSISIIPNEVNLYGTSEQLEGITQITTEYSVFENLKATSQLKARLKAIDGVIIKPNEVEVYIPVQEFTERQFEINITVINVPEDLDVKFFPSKVKITFSATLEDYKKIVPEDFEVELEYNSLKKAQTDQVDLNLTKMPPSILNPHISPAVVEFLFERK